MKSKTESEVNEIFTRLLQSKGTKEDVTYLIDNGLDKNFFPETGDNYYTLSPDIYVSDVTDPIIREVLRINKINITKNVDKLNKIQEEIDRTKKELKMNVDKTISRGKEFEVKVDDGNIQRLPPNDDNKNWETSF